MYKSKQQPMVTLSSTEAEFVALTYSVADLQWILNIFQEMDITIEKKVVYSDNQGAIKIATASEGTARTKHLDVKLQFTRFVINDLEILIRYVNTADNIADIFTKSLGRLNFTKLAQFLIHDFQQPKVSKEGVKHWTETETLKL